jgi:flagellar biosynthesis protein FlhG
VPTLPPPKRPAPLAITVAGGKGGVGKSTVAANLALVLGRLGKRVVVVDADFGAANLHTMFGILHPNQGIAELLDEKAETLDELAITLSVPTVSLVAGTSRPGAANLTQNERLRLLRGIAKLRADVVIIDVGAGTSYNVVDMLIASDVKLFVLTPQLPSLHNAYALLKACVHRLVRRLAAGETERMLIDSALGKEGKSRSVAELVDVLGNFDPKLAVRIRDRLAHLGAAIIGNQVRSNADHGVFQRMSQMIEDHLQISAPVAMTVPASAALAGSLKAGTGTIAGDSDPAFHAFRELARSLLDVDLDALRGTEPEASKGTIPIWIQRDCDPEAAAR